MKFIRSQGAVSLLAKIGVLTLIAFVGGLAGGVFLIQPGNYIDSGSAQAEALELSNQHVWGNQSGWAEAAIVVLNTGGRDTAIRRIAVRGTECDWSNVYYWKTDTGPISDELEQTSVELSGSSFSIVVDGIQRAFQQATGELTLMSGWTVVLYVKDPLDLTLDDWGEKVAITIFTEEHLYYEETIIDVTFTFMQTEQVSITNMAFSGTSNSSTNDIVLTVKNTGSSKTMISVATLNNAVWSSVTLSPSSGELAAGATGTVTLNDVQWISGNTYRVVLQSSTGTNIASYEKKAS